MWYESYFPSYDGNRAGWTEYEERLDNTLAMFEGKPERAKKKLGPLMRGRLTGKAWDLVRKLKRTVFVIPDGPGQMLKVLRAGREDRPHARTKAAMRRLKRKTVRRHAESIQDWLTRLDLIVLETKEVAEWEMTSSAWSDFLMGQGRIALDQGLLVITATGRQLGP